ncbi:hypothetical protein [Haladaptatus litoreus]|uniref:hypothetical protein n=1 Tax=Haladaptatus litoreus TaxID=553468 RepID=UPI001C37D030|nr:hypothetical protein [Haladaptatus litoreus]
MPAVGTTVLARGSFLPARSRGRTLASYSPFLLVVRTPAPTAGAGVRTTLPEISRPTNCYAIADDTTAAG